MWREGWQQGSRPVQWPTKRKNGIKVNKAWSTKDKTVIRVECKAKKGLENQKEKGNTSWSQGQKVHFKERKGCFCHPCGRVEPVAVSFSHLVGKLKYGWNNHCGKTTCWRRKRRWRTKGEGGANNGRDLSSERGSRPWPQLGLDQLRPFFSFGLGLV